uniref:Uncharacterized protein n=1 Tax=Anguilla anguilla TaxID=7936 RepID=A0A0E9R351_ANGAN
MEKINLANINKSGKYLARLSLIMLAS